MFSSIVPIQSSMSMNLNDSLNAQRSKTKGTVVSINEKPSILPYLVFGGISIIAGISVFYLLPLAVLHFNISLILSIFFAILLGMILGLTLIAFNFQRLLEVAIVKILLFFEK